MKKTFTLILLCGTIAVNAQSTVGLIAHWDMNGTTNDVSGNGDNGTGSNITAAAGIYGIPNTAYYFNGANSIITAPYLPDLNLTQYSICAIVNIEGFYSGLCGVNYIFERGEALTSGSYSLQFQGNPFNGGNCSVIDSAQEVFVASADENAPTLTDWQYSPQITKNNWYKVIATWDGTNQRIYVNDTLKTTVAGTGFVMGTSIADSIAIGMDLYEAASGYPYPFKGLIDDVRLYNRILTDSEIAHYGDTCGTIILQPATSNIAAGGNAIYTVSTSIVGVTYQWQENSGTGFVNLSNAGAYSGVNTNTLTVTGVTVSMNNYIYRCLLSNSWGCADTTSQVLLTLGINNVFVNDVILFYPNPTKSELTIKSSNNISNIVISNLIGQSIFSHEYNTTQVQVDVADLPAGIYLVRINGTELRKFVKQ